MGKVAATFISGMLISLDAKSPHAPVAEFVDVDGHFLMFI